MPPTPSAAPALSPLPPPEHPEDFDLFADVSHHGSSLFEFLAMPPHPLDAAAFAPVHHPPAAPHHHHHPLSAALQPRAISDTTAVPSDHPCSVSTTSLHPVAPPAPPPHTSVESYCTVDPSDLPTPRKSHRNLPPHAPPSRSAQSKPAVAPAPPAKPRRSAKPAPRPASRDSAAVHPHSAAVRQDAVAASAARRAPIPPGKVIAKPRTPPATAPNSRGTATRKKTRPVQRPTPPANRTASHTNEAGANDSDASEPSDDARGAATSKQRSPQSNSPANGAVDASSVLDEGQSKDNHNSHTRRCRAKVNSKFQELLSILPTPPPKTGIKHKAQILDYTIRVFRDIHARKTLLEAELALSSRSHLNNWIASIITRSYSLQDALSPYLSLICTKGGWKYSEAWVPTQESQRDPAVLTKMEGVSGESRLLTPATISAGSSPRLRLGRAVIPSLGNTDDPDLQSKLERFRDRSRSYGCKPRVDLPGRVMCTMRPEWLPSLEDQEAFQRARLARGATLVVCFGVPIFVRGRVAAVAVFFDTEQRPYDAKCVDLADNIAGLLGNAFGSATFGKRPL